MKRATYDDVLNAPEHKVAEILDGELFLSPRPAPRFLVAMGALGAILGNALDRGRGVRDGWWIIKEPELRFDEDVVVPDVAGWTLARMPQLPVDAFRLPPDWVCEVLSPVTERIDRSRKLRIYARVGVAHVWLLNPLLRTLEVLRLMEGAWTIVGVHVDSDVVRPHPFETVGVEMRHLWADAPALAAPTVPPPSTNAS